MKLIEAQHILHGWEVRDGYRWGGPTRRAAALSYCVQDVERHRSRRLADSRSPAGLKEVRRGWGEKGALAYRGLCAFTPVTAAQAPLMWYSGVVLGAGGMGRDRHLGYRCRSGLSEPDTGGRRGGLEGGHAAAV